MRELIDAHPIWFSGTLYEKHPELIYGLGEIYSKYIVLTNGVMYMIVLPHVLAIEYPVYSVVAYYGKVNGEWWSGRDIPEALLKANDKLIQIKTPDCHGSIAKGYLCHMIHIGNETQGDCWADYTKCTVRIQKKLPVSVVELIGGYHVPDDECSRDYTRVGNSTVYLATTDLSTLICTKANYTFSREPINNTMEVHVQTTMINILIEKPMREENMPELDVQMSELEKLQAEFQEKRKALTNILTNPGKHGPLVFGLFQDWVMDWLEMPLVKFFTGLSWVLFYLFVIIWILEKIGIYLWMKLKVILWGIPIAMHGAQGPVVEHIHMNEVGRARNYHHRREEREDARI